MSGEVIKPGKSFAEAFDPQKFIDAYWALKDNQDECIIDGVQISFRSLQKMFDKIPGGKSFIDVGSGPTFSAVFGASEKFQAIYLSDYVAGCRKELHNWIVDSPDAIGWTGQTKLAAERIYRMEPAELEARMRKTVSGVLDIDLTQTPSLKDPAAPQQYDAATCLMVLGPAASDFSEYKKCVQNLVSLVKPGGHLIISDLLNMGFPPKNGKLWHNLGVGKKQLDEALRDAGAVVLHEEGIEPNSEEPGLIWMVCERSK